MENFYIIAKTYGTIAPTVTMERHNWDGSYWAWQAFWRSVTDGTPVTVQLHIGLVCYEACFHPKRGIVVSDSSRYNEELEK